MQDKQMVLPRLLRNSRSPVFTPTRKNRVKIMMSQKAVLGMVVLPLGFGLVWGCGAHPEAVARVKNLCRRGWSEGLGCAAFTPTYEILPPIPYYIQGPGRREKFLEKISIILAARIK
jgi:hypothetical protein